MNVIPSAAALSRQQKSRKDTVPKVNFYFKSPQFELTLDEFEVYALKRLKVLRKIEQLKHMRSITPDVFRQKIDQLLSQEDLKDNSVIDEASHFILRLSYCQTEELRRWFLNYETQLLQHRLRALSDDQLATSVKDYCQLQPISRDEKDAMADKLQKFTTNPTEFAVTKFYAVPFQQVFDLVRKRQCFLYKGKAYVPQSKVIAILTHKYRSNLSRCLALMSNSNAAKLGSDDPEAVRIHPLIRNMKDILVNSEPDASGSALTGDTKLNANNVTQFKENMPLCMRQLQDGLSQDKKLKHWGRLQYGLFLKGAGLSMDDALTFFQRHFSRVTGEEFQKQYAYSIRHMHGKEGKRADYTPYSCSKIILGNAPNSGEHHGCPYKHYDSEYLGSLLQRLKIGDAPGRKEIMDLKKKGHFQLACQKHFEVAHPGVLSMDIPVDNVGNHPNAWFRASISYKEAKGEDGTAANVSP